MHLLPLAHNEALRFRRHPRGLDQTLITGGYPRTLGRNLNPAEWIGVYPDQGTIADAKGIAA